jgi:hypothetical protein
VINASGRVTASVTLIVSHAEFHRKEARLVDATSRAGQAISLLTGWRPEAGTRQAEEGRAAPGDRRRQSRRGARLA